MRFFSKQDLLKYAGSSMILDRGKAYATSDAIKNIHIEECSKTLHSVSGEVTDGEVYKTIIDFLAQSGEITAAYCTCSVQGTCKHITALGLYVLTYEEGGALDSKDTLYLHMDKEGEMPIFVFAPTRTGVEVRLEFPSGYASTSLEDAFQRATGYALTTKERVVASALFHEMKKAHSLEIMLPVHILDFLLIHMVGVKNFHTEDGKILSVLGVPAKVTFSVFTRSAFTLVTLDKGKLVKSSKGGWLFDEQEGSLARVEYLPFHLLARLSEEGHWMVPKKETLYLEQTLIPMLQNAGHIIKRALPEGSLLVRDFQVHVYLQRKTDAAQNVLAIELQIELKHGEESVMVPCSDAFVKFLSNVLSLRQHTGFHDYYKLLDLIQYEGQYLFRISDKVYFVWERSIFTEIQKALFPIEEKKFAKYKRFLGMDKILLPFGSEEMFFFIEGVERAMVEKKWQVHKTDTVGKISVRREKVSSSIRVESSGKEDWFSFSGTVTLLGKEYQMEDFLKKMDESGKVELPGSEFVMVENISELQKLKNFAAKLKKEDGEMKGQIWHLPELEALLEKTQSDFFSSPGVVSFMQEMQAGKALQKVPVPKEVQGVLRSYQAESLSWAEFLRHYHFGGILADDMGLGKTLQALSILASLKSPLPAIIICPKTLLHTWAGEIEKFFPSWKIAIIQGSAEERKGMIQRLEKDKVRVALTSYTFLQKDVALIKKYVKMFSYVILDEAQNIKNYKTKNAKVVKLIPSLYRLALTGTPLENSVMDMWSIFDFLMPGFLGTYSEFQREFARPIMKYGDNEQLHFFAQKVRPFLLRREKGTVLKELPPKIEQTLYTDMTPEQSMLYARTVAQAKEEIFDTVAEKGFEKSRIQILAALTKMRQICNHPRMILPEELEMESGKFATFFEFLDEARKENRKVLLFSSFVKTLKLLEEELQKREISYSYLDGKTKERGEAVKEFQEDPKKAIFLISIKAGGTGLTLTAADIVVLFDPWWNPMVEMQAMDRAHRIGQKKTVHVYSMITKDTLEEKMLSLQSRKKQLFDATVGETKEFLDKLTWEDVKGLFEM